MNKLEFLLVANQDDEKIILEYTESLRKESNETLVEKYNREQKLGIVGVRRQALYLVALRKVMKERFESSPIYIKDNCIIGIGEEIIMIDNKIYEVKNENEDS